MRTLTNAVLFQLTWFGCVLGGANGQAWWGSIPLAGLLLFSVRQPYVLADTITVACLIAVGVSLELIWIDQGILMYPLLERLLPEWIPMLWAGVALTINHSLAWFKRYPLSGAALAAVAAPICYLSGQQLGAVVVPVPLQLGWLSCAWFAVFYAVFRVMPLCLAKQRLLATLGR